MMKNRVGIAPLKGFGEAAREELPGFTSAIGPRKRCRRRYMNRHPSGSSSYILGRFAVTFLPDYWQPAEMLAA